MCVVSMVYDHFKPRLWPDVSPAAAEQVRRMIEDFKRARDAAKIVDAATGQPDCADPEKAKLEARVAELEAALAVGGRWVVKSDNYGRRAYTSDIVLLDSVYMTDVPPLFGTSRQREAKVFTDRDEAKRQASVRGDGWRVVRLVGRR